MPEHNIINSLLINGTAGHLKDTVYLLYNPDGDKLLKYPSIKVLNRGASTATVTVYRCDIDAEPIAGDYVLEDYAINAQDYKIINCVTDNSDAYVINFEQGIYIESSAVSVTFELMGTEEYIDVSTGSNIYLEHVDHSTVGEKDISSPSLDMIAHAWDDDGACDVEVQARQFLTGIHGNSVSSLFSLGFKLGSAAWTYPITISNTGIVTTPFFRSNTDGLYLYGNDAHYLMCARNLTSNTAGSNFSLYAGGATIGAIDKAGGTFKAIAGIATGNAGSSFEVYTATPVSIGEIATTSINDAGVGYSVDDVLTITNGANDATITIDTVRTAGVIATHSLGDSGAGYTALDVLTVTNGADDATVRVDTVRTSGLIDTTSIGDGGSGYAALDELTVTNGANDATIRVDTIRTAGLIATTSIGDSGSGYTALDTLTVTNGANDAVVRVDTVRTNGLIDTTSIGNGGSGYTALDELTVTNGANDAIVRVDTIRTSGLIATTSIGDDGSGYTALDILTVTNGANDATVRVDTVDVGGEVLTYTVIDAGTACIVGDNNATSYEGVGTGFLLDIDSIEDAGEVLTYTITNPGTACVVGDNNVTSGSATGSGFLLDIDTLVDEGEVLTYTLTGAGTACTVGDNNATTYAGTGTGFLLDIDSIVDAGEVLTYTLTSPGTICTVQTGAVTNYAGAGVGFLINILTLDTSTADNTPSLKLSVNPNGSVTENGLTTKKYSGTVLDNGTLSLPDAVSGYGKVWVSDFSAVIRFYFTSLGAITVEGSTGLTSETDQDGYLCLYPVGTTVTIKNTLNDSKVICYIIEYV